MKILLLIAFAAMGLGNLVMAAGDLLIADFEDDRYDGWTIEGDAFRKGPASMNAGTAYQVTGFMGDGFASSYRGHSLKPMGKLTSPEFTIQRDYINLLLGGSPSTHSAGVKVLVEGEQVACIAAVKGFHLNETSIPVKAFRGKKARIEIYDKNPGYWGLILVDQIRQSDTKVGFEPVTRDMKITDKLLLFPVAKSGTSRRMVITVAGIVVHDLTACLAMSEDEIAWWGYLDMGDQIGKTATIKLEEEIGGSVREMIECAAEPRCLLPKYGEKYRPQFHFSQLNGWNNDPNGMVYFNGRYHLFWQCNPLGTGWGNMYWGHASSPDLVNWTEHKRALRSGGGKGVPLEQRHPSMATGACFSGSGNVDHNNATGLNVGDQKTLLLFNSDMNAGISAFYSHDGINFQRWMQKYPLGITGRDAKFVFHKPTGDWVAVSFLENKEHGLHFPIFTSKDLQNWTLKQNFTDVHECPEFMELPVDGDESNKRWVLMEASSEYFIGSFDGKTFVPEHEEKKVTMIPRSCYAGQCFSNSPGGRAVYIGWAGLATEGMPFNQGFTIPMDLTLRTVKDGSLHLFANPVKEVESLRKSAEFREKDIELTDGNRSFSKALSGELYDITVALRKKGAPKTATITIGKVSLVYNFATERFGKIAAPLKDGRLNMRILVDRATVEIFMADGYSYRLQTRKAMSGTKPGAISIKLDAPADSGVVVDELTAYPMKSIWQ